jgi:hypothetical protein
LSFFGRRPGAAGKTAIKALGFFILKSDWMNRQKIMGLARIFLLKYGHGCLNKASVQPKQEASTGSFGTGAWFFFGR